jgi:hypothetical protein
VADPIPGVRLGDVVREDAVGTILAATDAATGEALAVRRLHRPLAAEEPARLVFAEEARRVFTLRHPNLLAVRRVDLQAPVPFYVTDPVGGETLEAARRRDGVEEREVRPLIRAILDAMHHLERRGQFHAAPIPSRIVRVGDAWRLLTFRDVRAEDEAMRMKGKPPPHPDWSPPELAAESGGGVRAKTLVPWFAAALWRFLRTGLAPGETHDHAPWQPTPEEQLILRWLDREPLRRPSGAELCLSQLDALDGRASAPPTAPPIAPAKRPRRPLS